jgi:outer membrane protease
LRGSSVYATPTYPVTTSEPLYQEPAPAPRPAAARPARLVAPAGPAAQLHGFTFELGTRYWYSTGKLAKDLYDDPRSSQILNSRLTYSGLTSGSLEGFGRADTTFGSFIRGFAGFSGLNRGGLNDEDFPPALSPYSNTLSQQQGGKLTYGSIDFGQIIVKNERVRASVFVGYGYLNESVSAFGCNQIAGNPFVCAPAIAPGVLAITENSSWQFARLGVLAEFKVLDRLKLSAEVAWLPYEQITAQDTHWLRLGSGLFDISGPIPENGGGTGVQLVSRR